MPRSFWERLRARFDPYDDDTGMLTSQTATPVMQFDQAGDLSDVEWIRAPEQPPPNPADVLTVHIARDFYERQQRALDIVRTIDRRRGDGWCANLAEAIRLEERQAAGG